MEKQFQLKGLGATDHNRIEHFIIKESERATVKRCVKRDQAAALL
jgi:hypothetical protein